MDSTLITIECVDEIADMMGIRQEVAAITASAMRGEIDFRQSLTRRVALLRGLNVAALQRVYDERLELSPGAERLLTGMRASARSRCWSQAGSLFTERLKARLGLDHTCANTLEIVDGAATAAWSADRRRRGEGRAERLRATLPRTAAWRWRSATGNDLPMLEAADVSIATATDRAPARPIRSTTAGSTPCSICSRSDYLASAGRRTRRCSTPRAQ